MTRGILEAGSVRKEGLLPKPGSLTFHTQTRISRSHFSVAVFFRVTHNGLSYKLSYSTYSFTFTVILFLLFEINAFVGACSNLPVRSAVAFGKPRIFVTVTMSRPLIGRKHKDTQSSPRSSASILKFKRIENEKQNQTIREKSTPVNWMKHMETTWFPIFSRLFFFANFTDK